MASGPDVRYLTAIQKTEHGRNTWNLSNAEGRQGQEEFWGMLAASITYRTCLKGKRQKMREKSTTFPFLGSSHTHTCPHMCTHMYTPLTHMRTHACGCMLLHTHRQRHTRDKDRQKETQRVNSIFISWKWQLLKHAMKLI